ncbi:MAG: 2Fe-2S iron-sulfur cluster-binding protein [Rhodanobacter sp.]
MNRSGHVQVTVNGRAITVPFGASAAAAIAISGSGFRRSVTGQARSPLCGMGVCFECRVGINGVPHQRACMATVSDDMRIETDE